MTGLRIVVGADDAGVEYKNILRRDLEADERVTSVVDVGVDEEAIAYPHIAVQEARLVATGQARPGPAGLRHRARCGHQRQ